jgi:hypothetical protein
LKPPNHIMANLRELILKITMLSGFDVKIGSSPWVYATNQLLFTIKIMVFYHLL